MELRAGRVWLLMHRRVGQLIPVLSSYLKLTPHDSSEWCCILQRTLHQREAVWSSRQGEEGRREGSQASQTNVLASAAVQEEIAEDEGSRGRQGWARLYHCSGLYKILSPFSAA